MKQRFHAIVEAGHKGCAAIVPFDPTQVWGLAPRPIHAAAYGKAMPGVPVRGRLGKIPFTGWIGTRRGRRFVLLDDALLRAAGVKAGDEVTLELELDADAPASAPIAPKAVARARRARPAASEGKGVVLLSGGNPQIAKGDGDAVVQAYLAAMPGWKRVVGQRIDACVDRAVPGVQKAVRWNSPFYGLPGRGWFLSMHCLTSYVKVAFLNGAELTPLPPVPSKVPGTRYLHLGERDTFDEAAFARWVKQAARLPGATCF